MELKDDTTLISATNGGYPLDVYDDGMGPLFAYGHEFGPTLIIRAQTFCDAYEIAIDESATIPPSELPEAYGYDTQEELDAAYAADPDNFVELAEGYCYQSNFTGTGIVDEGHYAWLREIDAAWLRATGVKLAIRHYDDVEASV